MLKEGKLNRKIWVIDTFLGLLNQATYRAKKDSTRRKWSVGSNGKDCFVSAEHRPLLIARTVGL